MGLFVYQSLDAIDGKQARRTGSANPLGELFDHGCDSISTVFVALSACTAVQLGFYPDWMFFQVRINFNKAERALEIKLNFYIFIIIFDNFVTVFYYLVHKYEMRISDNRWCTRAVCAIKI